MLIFAGISFTLGDTVDTLDPTGVHVLSVLNEDFFMPLAGGTCAMLFAAGLSVLRTGALPRWLGWAALVIAVASVTPAGFFAYLASLLWVLVTGIVLATRDAAPMATP